MKFIRVQIQKHKGKHYIKLPKILIDNSKLSDGDEIEISIRNPQVTSQTNLWEQDYEISSKIEYSISSETMTMNMRSKIYVPIEYRYIFPPSLTDFILETNAGNFQTHINHEGYITKGMKSWFIVNQSLEENDILRFEKLDGSQMRYKLLFIKST